MILGFKDQLIPPILSDDKIHTLRSGNRWKKGMKIHFAKGVRTKNYECFKEGDCISTQEIMIIWNHNNIGMINESWGVKVFIDGRNVTNDDEIIDKLAKNDGFKSRKEFFEWKGWYKKSFDGQIIHWTPFRY